MRAAVRSLALLLTAAPALAQDDARWPGLYDVTGVDAGDVLNVRAAAGAAHQIVGTLAPDARDIEVIRPDEHGGWGLVNLGERTGWVSLDFLERHADDAPGALPPIRRCFGTEPFWSVGLDSEGIVEFSEPDAQSEIGTVSWRAVSSSRPGSFAMGTGEDAATMVAMVDRQACTDGMSDRQYGFSVDLVRDTGDGNVRLLSGCCSLAVAN